MSLLSHQFPELDGFQSCLCGRNRSFKRHSDLFIQIINRSPTGKGSHWITVSNLKALDLSKDIVVYDSAYTDIPHEQGLVIASLVDIKSDVLNVHFANVQMQRNAYDCGFFAIANAITLAFGQNPANQTYDARQMRSHLIGCLENKTMTKFPVVRFSGKRKSIKKSIAIEIFCLCRLPDTNELYVFCDECSSEFHPECVNITKPITNSMKFTCPKCLIK